MQIIYCYIRPTEVKSGLHLYIFLVESVFLLTDEQQKDTSGKLL